MSTLYQGKHCAANNIFMSKRFVADSAILLVHIGYLGCQGRDPLNAATSFEWNGTEGDGALGRRGQHLPLQVPSSGSWGEQ